MAETQDHPLKNIKAGKIILPIVIGLGVILYMLYNEISDVGKLQLNVLNYSVNSVNWKEIKSSDDLKTFECTLKDTAVIKLDSLKLSIHYIAKNSEKPIMFSDTIHIATGSELTFSGKNVPLQKVDMPQENKIVFSFSKPLQSVFSTLNLTSKTLFWIFIAFLMMAIRDFGYMLRIKILTDDQLSWRQCFNLIMLWEFTSALTPSVIGGSGVAIFLLNKEGVSVGRSTAVIMSSIFLDELYFLTMVPLVFIVVSGAALFTIGGVAVSDNILSFTNQFFYFAVIGYIVIFIFTAFLTYGLFVNPRGTKWLLLWIFKLPLLRKWRQGANQSGTDLIVSSKELRTKPLIFWIKAYGATIFSWTGRYWIVNILLLGLIGALMTDPNMLDHFLIFARQLIMWIMMIISPTPGGSGFAEFVFSKYLGEFIPIGFAVAMALLWRLISYYPYLMIGTIMLPRWLKNKFGGGGGN